MSVVVASDMRILQEANQILMKEFSPAKMVRLWALWQTGSGDYLGWRDEAFAGKTVAQLFEEIEEYQVDGKPSK